MIRVAVLCCRVLLVIPCVCCLRSKRWYHTGWHQTLPVIAIRMIVALGAVLLGHGVDVLGLLLQPLMLLLLLIKLIHGHGIVKECVVSQPCRVRSPQLPLGAFLQLLLFLDLSNGSVSRGNQLLLLLLLCKLTERAGY